MLRTKPTSGQNPHTRFRAVALAAVLAIAAIELVSVVAIVLAGRSTIERSLTRLERNSALKAFVIGDWALGYDGDIAGASGDFFHHVPALRHIESVGSSFIVSETGSVIARLQNSSFLFLGFSNDFIHDIEARCIEVFDGQEKDSAFAVRVSPGETLYCVYHTMRPLPWIFCTIVPSNVIIRDVSGRVVLSIVIFLTLVALVFVLFFVATRAAGKTTGNAESRARMKSQFLANMSHELRTPINGVIGFTDLALNSKNADEMRRYIAKTRDCANGLRSVVDNILDMSKIESGKLRLESIPFSLQNIFGYCETAMSVLAEEKGIGLSFVYGDEDVRYAMLMGDPTKLTQVLINLLSNAVKFTHTGAVEAFANTVAKTNLSVSIEFSVKDSGIGMSAEHRSRIFEPFEQADSAVSRKYGGTGLGLSISKNLVAMMGGELSVESVLGKGSSFTFTLDFPLAHNAGSLRETVPGRADCGFSATILVCEDSEINQDVITEQLERLGIDVVIASNGRLGVDEAMRRLDAEEPLDLIFMDIFLPELDGISASKELRARGCRVPIVALTANAPEDDLKKYSDAGIDDRLGKPFTCQELSDCLVKYLRPAPRPRVQRDSNPLPAA